MAIVKANKAKKYSGIYRHYRDSDKRRITQGYYLKYRDEFGKSPMKKLNAKTLEEAVIEATDIRSESKKKKNAFKQDAESLQRAIDTKTLKLDEVAKMYFDSREKLKNNVQDRAVYNSRVSPVLGQVEIKAVNLKMMGELQDTLALKFAPKTVNNSISLMMGMFTYSQEKKYITDLPISRRSNKKSTYIEKIEENIESGRVLTQEELDALFSSLKYGRGDFAPNPRLYLFCKILYYTGVRPAAAIEIKVSDYDAVNHTLKFKAMKKAKAFRQNMHDELIPRIEVHIKEHNLVDDECLFYPVQTYKRTGKDKDTPSSLRGFTRRIKVLHDELFNQGVTNPRKKVTFYSLRRTSATRLYKAKGLIEASKFLHHSDVRTTAKYLNIDDELKEAINDAL